MCKYLLNSYEVIYIRKRFQRYANASNKKVNRQNAKTSYRLCEFVHAVTPFCTSSKLPEQFA